MNIENLIKNSSVPGYDYDILIDQVHTFIESNISHTNKRSIYFQNLNDIDIKKRIDPYYGDEEGNKDLNKLLRKIQYFLESTDSIGEIEQNSLNINIHPEIYFHIESLLKTEHYYSAVEESFKFTRDKLKQLTGEEQGHKAFAKKNYESIFGREPDDDIENDFCEGVKFLNLAIQNFRNEKSHSIKKDLDYNKAIHYITLSSLALNLIEQKL